MNNYSAQKELAFNLHKFKLVALARLVMVFAAKRDDVEAKAALACWRWDSSHDHDLESELRAGMEHFESCRPDLAELLQERGDEAGALFLLTEGYEQGEIMCFIPLANAVRESDPTFAREILMRASDAGDGHASHNLAIDFAYAKDFARARHFGELAFRQGDRHAGRFLRDLPTE